MDTDEEYYSDEQVQYNILDDFIYNELDNVLDLYHDIINRFPYFLNSKSYHFTQFVIDNCILKSWTTSKVVVNNDYVTYYENEIETTLWVLNNFLGKKRLPLISMTSWIEFCYLHR